MLSWCHTQSLSPTQSRNEVEEESDDIIENPSKGSIESASLSPQPGSSDSKFSQTILPNYGSMSEDRTAVQGVPSSSSTSPSELEPVSGFTAPPERNTPPQRSAFRVLKDSIVRVVLLSYFCLALISTSNDVIFALWMFLSVKDGGVGLKVSMLLLSPLPAFIN